MIAAVCLSGLVACMASQGDVGVRNQWRQDLNRFEDGRSTQGEVLQALGPPSQLVPLDGRIVFYYVLERRKGRDFYLVLYNQRRDKVVYDRAIFFFDEDGILLQHAYSAEEIPFEAAEEPKK
jgi:hypothetical protein